MEKQSFMIDNYIRSFFVGMNIQDIKYCVLRKRDIYRYGNDIDILISNNEEDIHNIYNLFDMYRRTVFKFDISRQNLHETKYTAEHRHVDVFFDKSSFLRFDFINSLEKEYEWLNHINAFIIENNKESNLQNVKAISSSYVLYNTIKHDELLFKHANKETDTILKALEFTKHPEKTQHLKAIRDMNGDFWCKLADKCIELSKNRK